MPKYYHSLRFTLNEYLVSGSYILPKKDLIYDKTKLVTKQRNWWNSLVQHDFGRNYITHINSYSQPLKFTKFFTINYRFTKKNVIKRAQNHEQSLIYDKTAYV